MKRYSKCVDKVWPSKQMIEDRIQLFKRFPNYVSTLKNELKLGNYYK